MTASTTSLSALPFSYSNGNPGAGASYVVFGSSSGFEASLKLSELDGNNGFVLKGIDIGDRSGDSVSGAGDMNGDDIDDIIIGAPYAGNPVSNSFFRTDTRGESYVVFGSSSGFDASLELAELNGTNGFVLNGVDAGDESGRSVSGAGDINGDGFDDIIIDAPYGGYYRESYVVFGSSSGFDASLELAELDGTNGFVLKDFGQRNRSWGSVSGAGDINGDGFDDLIIGAPLTYSNGNPRVGESYVVFGSSEFDASLNSDELDGTNGFVISGIGSWSYSGESVSGAGDINGDGLDDIIISTPYARRSSIVFGRRSGFDASLELSELDGTNGFDFTGVVGGFISVSGAGDINGDGIDDLIIGANLAGNPVFSYYYNYDLRGESYVVFGSSSGFDASLNPSELDGTNGFILSGINAGDRLGGSVSGAGDINDDGIDDLLIGTFFGESYVIFGSTTLAGLVGTEDSNTLVDFEDVNQIYGLGGSDTIAGLAGDDEIFGGDGDDVLRGRPQ